MIDADELKKRLKKTGEPKVRERLASNVYGLEERGVVEEWLASKERQVNRQTTREQLDIAKSAKHAAWIAAGAAIISAAAAIAAWLWR